MKWTLKHLETAQKDVRGFIQAARRKDIPREARDRLLRAALKAAFISERLRMRLERHARKETEP